MGWRKRAPATGRTSPRGTTVRRLGPDEFGDPGVWRGNLGRKTSMRLRLSGDPQHPFTEAVGVVQAVRTHESGADVLVLVSRRGEEREVPLADILAAKIF
jgi:hypothetical protein